MVCCPIPRDNEVLVVRGFGRRYSQRVEGEPSLLHAFTFAQGKYSLLEAHHGYIQWLFPIREG